MTRRDDIQGLRAVAVASVILFHLGIFGFGGGFVGVDVFFVISGFLIARKLYDDIDRAHLIGSLAAFWGARAKRLLPNALLTLLLALIAAALFLPFYRVHQIGFDVAAAAIFYSNVHFAHAAVDYFHHSDPPSLVLHFWSLSIEEQFYGLLPIGVAVAALAGRRKLLVNLMLVGIAAFSFLWAQRAIHLSQPSAFFLLQNRMWQFALGGLLGVNFDAVRRIPVRARAVAAALGLALVLGAVAGYADVIYPGLWAILPTLGAGLMIADDCGIVSRVLRYRPAVWVGDRSYSLYLWHWPLLALATERFGGGPVAKSAALAIAVSLALAVYKWIERPIHRSHIAIRAPSLRLSGAAVAVAAVAFVGWAAGTAPPPFDVRARTAAIEAASKDFGRNYADDCHMLYDQTGLPPCVYGDKAARRTVVLFGDSHAAEWFNPLVAAASATGWKVIARTKTSCPAADVSIWYPPAKVAYTQCDRWRSKVLAVLTRHPPQAVVISDYSRYFGWIEDRTTKKVLAGVDATRAYRAGLKRTVDKLLATGAPVTIIRDNPMMNPHYLDCLAWQDDCSTPRIQALRGMDTDPDIFPPGAHVVDFTDAICNGVTCPAMRNGRIIYQDSEHLAASYAATFEPQFEAILAGDGESGRR